MVRNLYLTERLSIRLADPVMADYVFDYYRRNEAFFKAFDPVRPPEFYTLEYHRAALAGEHVLAKDDKSYRFYISLRGQDEIIGMVGLNNLIRGAFESCFLSYKLDVNHKKNGYMTEALRKVLAVAFGELGLHRVEANILPDNYASIRTAEKAGLEKEAYFSKYLKISGEWRDHVHYVAFSPLE